MNHTIANTAMAAPRAGMAPAAREPSFAAHGGHQALGRRPGPPGMEHRTDGQWAPWLARMLDEIDYGMLLVTADARLLYANHSARHELVGDHPLRLLGQNLVAHRGEDVAPLCEALAAAQRGLRTLLTLGEGAQRVSVSVVPLPVNPGDPGELRRGGHGILLVLGKRQMSAPLSVQAFARSMQLTPAETRVLDMLCNGVRPSEVATRQGVALSTVRTHIGNIRAKTGAAGIRDLVRQVGLLPPLVGALRHGVPNGSV